MKKLIIILLILFSTCVFGQNAVQDSVLAENNSRTTENEYKPLEYPVKFNGLLVQTSIQLGNLSAKGGLVYPMVKMYRHGFTAKAVSVEFGSFLRNNMNTAAVGWSYTSYAIVFGGNIGAKGVYYWQPKGESAFALRPEIGILIFNVGISYGYDIFFNKGKLPLKNHNLTVSAYIPLFQF